MNGERTGLASLAFRATLAATAAVEMTVGPVWGPGYVDEVTVQVSALGPVLRGFAVPSRLPTRTGLTIREVISAEPLFVTAAAQADVAHQTGYEPRVLVHTVLSLGRVVPWAPWWLLVRIDQLAAAAASMMGTVRVKVFEDLVRVAPEAFAREVARGAGYGRLGGRNPHGLGVGYRSWV